MMHSQLEHVWRMRLRSATSIVRPAFHAGSTTDTLGLEVREMLVRALVVWCVLLVIASINGGLREAVIIPAAGETAGRVVSTLLLSAAILVLSWLTIGWVGPASTRDAVAIGGLWVALTLAFEFLAGHYLFGHPWSYLLEDYNLARGRIWILVLIVTAVAPWMTASMRGLLRG